MAIDLSRVKAICFDVDGTLSDTDDEWVARFSYQLRVVRFLFRHGDPQKFARWLIMVTETPMNAVYHWLDHLSLDDNFAALYEKMIQNRKGKPRPFWLMNHAQELIQFLYARFPLSIVSARDEMTTKLFMDQFELQHFFSAVATSQTCEHTKPFPQPILWAAEQMKVPAQNCLMVGDTTVDILAGKAAGAQTVGVLCGFGTEAELRKAGADLIVKDLRELHEIIDH
jgi:HAD superfamily hydrolase (TIGR01549 family)